MDVEDVERFTQRWLEAWNSHDLEAILSHFTDDVVFTSPLAVEMVDWSDGVVRGKAALREYWAQGLRQSPELHFDLEALYVGVDTLVINYASHTRGLVCEVLTFRDGLVCEGHGTYVL